MLRHLTDTRDFSKEEIKEILLKASQFLNGDYTDTLKKKLVINIFFENSTRTRSSFEVAAKRLGAEVVNLDVATSSSTKGETLSDTATNLDAMGPSAIVIRHSNPGVPKILSRYVKSSIVNGGDGAYAHPTQALLDLFTLNKALGSVEGKNITIVGDIKNSRVANSNIELLQRFNANVTLVAPVHFMPSYSNVRKLYKLEDAIKDTDAIISLRTQTERHQYPIYASLKDYALDYKITKKLIGDKKIFLLHPGPVHRNIDIDDDMLEDERTLVLKQVENGVAVRMAVLEKLILDR
ncbi:MAG: aspartate carbamoyltransferase catalytic subunit [Campylobacterota bacterium]|nr:aspartate carbamoyltransferase catalytic subunit [Campylobacterota bacterium]